MKMILQVIGVIVVVALVGVGVGVWAWTPDLKRLDLEAKYLRGPGDLIEVEGVRLHVRDDGPREAPAVLLLHGMGSSLHT